MLKDNRSLSIAPVCALLLLSGCGWLRPGGPPDEAGVEISSGDVDKAFIVSLPDNRTIKFNSRQQLLVESYPDVDEATRLGMRVTIDGDERYNNFATLQPATGDVPRQSLYFAYTFGGRPLNTGGGIGG